MMCNGHGTRELRRYPHTALQALRTRTGCPTVRKDLPMAHIIPSDITELALAGASEPELATLDRLRRDLPGDYVVFHGVHWSREYAGYTVYGEVDFVVVNRAGRVLLVEQKNGPLTETDAGLVKSYASGPKSVNDQVRRALDNVREKFRWVHGAPGRSISTISSTARITRW